MGSGPTGARGLRYLRIIHGPDCTRLCNVISSGLFAVIIDKPKIDWQEEPQTKAWEYLFQRLRQRTRATGAPIVLVHDNGSVNDAVRAHLRRFRRISWTPRGQPDSAPLLIEDPVPRDSQHSYFVQLADLAAYAASRRVLPAKGRGNSICSEQMWSEAASALRTEVESRRGDAIVVWPR